MSVTSEQAQAVMNSFPPFVGRVSESQQQTLEQPAVMQVNVGRLCNLSCRHCHMEAGPHSSDSMSHQTFEQCLAVCVAHGFSSLDITGGAPEMNPHFEWFIRQAAVQDIDITVRTNLVVLHEEPYRHLPELFAELGVTVIASLPHYTAKAVEKQRGSGVFNPALAMLKQLNSLGYGAGKGLVLNLVFNPSGAFLPPDQAALEKEYKAKLAQDFGIVFDNLFAIANNPVGRFGNLLQKTGNLERYMTKLMDAFNPETLENMMCRNQLSVGWDGELYDCDFNQAANLPCQSRATIADLARGEGISLKRFIAFGNHCYACTAGTGSS